MNVRLVLADEKYDWNWSAFSGGFLQSWEWAEVQQRLGAKTWQLVLEADKPLNQLFGLQANAVALVIKRPLPFGRSWLYVPRGPVVYWDIGSAPSEWFLLREKLAEIAEQERAIFIRIDPAWPEESWGAEVANLRKQGWKKSEREVQPKNTLVLELKKKSEEELLSAMHPKTRYNIRLAERKGVTVRFSSEVTDVDHFLRLSHDVSDRSQFSYHPDEYYRTILEVLGKKDEGDFLAELNKKTRARAEVALAEYEGEVLAAHIVISFHDTTTYAHGASSSKLRELMAPHLLQWETIKRAKADGQYYYDFFGIAPEGAEKDHPWAGITRFKLGFGGERVDYIGAYDLVIHPGMYHLSNAARRLKSLLR